ncbi:MAG TPA: hypothetical protein VK671_13065 [Mucilaginibacter sp.]|jgi:hypothetical protein|nr:hypothetical protein [Mucilaginibacter sp.]
MKKTILIMASLFATLGSFAQTTKIDSANDLKPNAKSFTTELNVNPLKGQVNLNNSLNQIKFRYFTSPTVALRLGFNISRIDSVNNVNNPYGTNSFFDNDEKKSTTIGVNLGIEKHFLGTKRLSPYIGADLSITNKSSGETLSNNQSTTTVTNAWYYSYYSNNTLITQTQQNGYTRYGLNLFTGFDFYIARHFFFGYEFNYSISKTNWKEVSIITTPSTGTNTTNPSTKNSNLTFGPSLINGIRLGYSF